MTEYEAQARATREKITRLKPLRLAKEAQAHKTEADLKQIREALAPLESGQMHLSERENIRAWRNVTERWITHHKRLIETYETILAALREKAPKCPEAPKGRTEDTGPKAI